MPNFDELQFEPLLLPNGMNLVPRYLFEQIKGNDWDIDNIYKYGALFIVNPLNRLWLLTDLGHVAKGILWIAIDPLRSIINVIVLSVDPEYQKPRGEAIKKSVEFLRVFRNELKSKGVDLNEKIITGSKRPTAFIRAGFKESEYITLEI